MATYLPAGFDLAVLASVVLAALVLMLFGRVLSAGRAVPELALIAGWGGFAFLLTLWGIATPLSLRIPALIVAGVALLGLALPRLRPSGQDWRALGRVLVLALPLLGVMAGARPSQPDTFLNLLPNAAYLYDYGTFPADGRPDSFSFLPAAPYNLQLAGLLAALPLPAFPAGALAFFNILLQLAIGLMIARVLRPAPTVFETAPGWGATAAGLLLATGLNPGFVPRIYFSSYSEAGVAVALAAAGFVASAAWRDLALRRAAGPALWLLALPLLALVNIKQESPAFVAALIVSAALLAALDPAVGPARALRGFLPAAFPAALLYLGWRGYVALHFSAGAELTLQPLAAWQPGILPSVLGEIVKVMLEKIVYFATIALALGLLAFLLRRVGLTPATRLLALFAGVLVLYNAFLLFTYVAHFPGVGTPGAHSYFRYSTHLSLLLMLALAAAVRELVPAVPRPPAWLWRRALPGAAVALMLVSPLGFAKRLRFDHDMPQPLVWDLAAFTASHVADGDRLALILPADNGSDWVMLKGALRLMPPRRPHLDLAERRALDGDTLAGLAAVGYDHALISCVPPGFGDLPAGQAVMLERRDGRWQVVARWGYPPSDPHRRWQPMLAAAPLCRTAPR